MKLLAHSKNGLMVKLEESTNPKGYDWYFLAPNVKEFAQTIAKDTDVEVKIEQKNEGNTITFIKQTGGSMVKETNSFKPGTGFACTKCGAKLKDDTYKTCYTCSMEARNAEAKSPEEKNKQDSIKRQAIGHMTSRTLIALQGHVDPNNVYDIAEQIYKKYVELVG